jgi:hypothetical protein
LLFRIKESLALEGDIAVSGDDGEGPCAVFVQVGIGHLGHFGGPEVGGFENLLGELAFEFLADFFHFGLDLVQFVDIERRKK